MMIQEPLKNEQGMRSLTLPELCNVHSLVIGSRYLAPQNGIIQKPNESKIKKCLKTPNFCIYCPKMAIIILRKRFIGLTLAYQVLLDKIVFWSILIVKLNISPIFKQAVGKICIYKLQQNIWVRFFWEFLLLKCIQIWMLLFG